jgi:hypothetical protein
MLPKWATDNRTSLRSEAADYVDMTPAERLALVDLLCRDAQLMLSIRADAERVRAYRDPLPESSEELLRELRALQRARLDRDG